MLSLLLLLPPAFAAPAMDTGSSQDMACFGPYPTAIIPRDGSTDVSPATVPAVLVNVDCDLGDLTVTLTPDSGPASTMTLSPDHSGVIWLTDLALEPDATYTLTVGATDWGSMSSTFYTGHAPIAVTGAPSVTVHGSSLAANGAASVSVEVQLAVDPAGAVYTLSRDREPLRTGVDSGAVVDSFIGEDDQEVCYTVTQFLGDGSVLGTSPESCVTLGLIDVKSGCSTAPGAAGLAPALGALLALLGLRRTTRR